jgi:ABC-type multidrug transport system fused ATPase/permease subunit
MVGESLASASDYRKGKAAAKRIFELLDRTPRIKTNAYKIIPTDFHGDVAVRDVHFNYPTRRNDKILRGLSFDVSRGQTVALVGSSGCGKSTCISLIERFYDWEEGEIVNELFIKI